MLNLLLSLFVCMALSVGSVGALPATPETATSTVVRNVTIGLDEESVTLNPEMELVTAIGQSQALAHFEIRSGDDVLLPMSLDLEPDYARFALMNSGRSYSITENALLGMIFDGASGKEVEQLRSVLDGLANLYYADAAMLAMLRDEELSRRFESALLENWMDATGTMERKTEVEIDGALYAGRHIDLHSDVDGLIAAVDATAGSEDADVAAVARLILEMLNQYRSVGKFISENFDLSEISPLALNESGEAVPLTSTLPAGGNGSASGGGDALPNLEFDIEFLLADGVDVVYEKVDAIVSDLDAISEERINYELVQQENVSHLEYRVHSSDSLNSGTETLVEVSGDITEADENSGSVNLEYNIEFGDSGIFTGTEAYRIRAYGAISGDLGDANDVRFDMELEEDGASLATFNGSYADSGESDGARSGHVELALSLKDEKDPHDLTLSFDVDRVKSAPTDYFADLQELSLGDESSNGVAMLRLEALGLAANAATLASEESVLQLQSMFSEGFAFRWSGMMQVEKSVEYVDMYEAKSVEDAAKIFEGRIPDFTPPAGYELDQIRVSSYSYHAYYVNGEKAFRLDLNSYGQDQPSYSVQHALLQEDGTLKSISGTPVDIYTTGGAVNYASISRDDMTIYISFKDPGVNLNEFRAILAGLGQ